MNVVRRLCCNDLTGPAKKRVVIRCRKIHCSKVRSKVGQTSLRNDLRCRGEERRWQVREKGEKKKRKKKKKKRKRKGKTLKGSIIGREVRDRDCALDRYAKEFLFMIFAFFANHLLCFRAGV